MARLRGFIWLFAGIIIALLAGFVAFVTLSRASAMPESQSASGLVNAPNVQVVVTTHEVPVRSLLTTDDLTTRMMPVDAVPEGAVKDVNDAVGQITLVDLYEGEIVLSQRLVDPNVASKDGKMALIVADDQVLMAIPSP
jgi:Flp pilus assembly protein CpaB